MLQLTTTLNQITIRINHLGQISNEICSLPQVILSLDPGNQLVSSGGRVERPQPRTQIDAKKG